MAAFLAAGLILAGCQEESEGQADTATSSDDTTSATTDDSGSAAENTEATTSNTGAASEEATDAAVEAARSNESPAESSVDAARDAAGEEGATGATAGNADTLDDLLTPEAWDSARVVAAIRAADLPQDSKDRLIERVRSLDEGEDPALRDQVIAELREALVSR